ncbi:MAG: hypothetical protein ACREF4_10515 [Gammaproteobacteria bacterium]
MRKETRALDLARTVAAIVDAHVRGETTDVELLLHSDDDNSRHLARVAAAVAVLACELAYRFGHNTHAVAFYLQATSARKITADELRRPEVQRMLIRGIGQGAGYMAAMSVKSLGREDARSASQRLVVELAVREP